MSHTTPTVVVDSGASVIEGAEMNANELADKLEQGHWEGGTREQAATMLRQQQAEIEALKNGFNTTWAGTNNSEMAEVRAMANRCILKIQELEFEQEGFENLVEMLESEKEELVEKTRQQQAEYYSLLVNHDKLYAKVVEQQAEIEALKAKTLTDEEIISSAEEARFNWSEDKGIFVRHSNGSWIGLDSKMVDFARAILRKAQEK